MDGCPSQKVGRCTTVPQKSGTAKVGRRHQNSCGHYMDVCGLKRPCRAGTVPARYGRPTFARSIRSNTIIPRKMTTMTLYYILVFFPINSYISNAVLFLCFFAKHVARRRDALHAKARTTFACPEAIKSNRGLSLMR